MIQCYSDSEEEEEGVEEVFTTREESLDTEMTEILPVTSTPTLTHGSGPLKISMPSEESNENNLLENDNV